MESPTGSLSDVDGDGVDEKLAWANEDDAVLVFDANNNDQIDNTGEFAFAEFSENPFATDMEGLAEAFDTNKDGVLSSMDEEWDQFKLWQDKNGNGETDEGEMVGLEEVGIESIV